MKRRLRIITGSVLFTICAALLVLWIRSAYAGDVVYVRTSTTEYIIRSDWGRLSVTATEAAHPEPSIRYETTSGGWAGWSPGPAKRKYNLGMVHAHAGTKSRSTLSFWKIETYHPVVIAVFALPLLPWGIAPLRKWKATRRRRAGFCPRCGYDVRASGERCPECGETIGAMAADAALHVPTK